MTVKRSLMGGNMAESLSGLVRIFSRGLGLKISLAFLPPIALAWIFFGLYLHMLALHQEGALVMAILGGLIGVLLGSVVVIWLVLTTIPPIRRIIDVTVALSEGEYSIEIPFLTKADETGQLARALEVFRQHVQELQGVDAIKADKEKDLNQKRELLCLADALEGEVDGTVKDVMSQAGTMSKSARDAVIAITRMQSLYQSLSGASDETLNNINAVAGSSDELAAASREIASQMARTIAITQEAVSEAQQAESTMHELSEVSTHIVEVLQLISQIAAQTNLLALNATIEAARAGEAGKGFAVVAGEVKVLANQTAKAVEAITGQVENIQDATANGVRAIDAVSRTIDQVNNVASAVASAVEQQEASTRGISESAQRAAEQAERVSRDAAGISSEAVNVDSMAALLESGANDVADRLNNMERRLSGILTHTVGADAKIKGRFGQQLTGAVQSGNDRQSCRLDQADMDGMVISGVRLTAGAEIEVTVEDFGLLRAKVRELIGGGARVDLNLESGDRARWGEFLFGHLAPDQPFINYAKERARLVEQAFEAALAKGEITLDALFDEDYQPIAGTNPQQHMTRYATLADKVLPAIQEPALSFNPKIAYCVSADRNGFAATHHAHCSKPQGPDPVWNAANCRNRRLFRARAELAAVSHQQDHLLQTFIRDMGGGNMMLLKDASVPIMIRGRHWGGLRLGYKL